MAIESINPATGEGIKKYREFTARQVEGVLSDAQKAFEEWRKTSFSERAAKMLRASEMLRKNRDQYANLMAMEMGKPLPQGQAEVDKCAWVCDYYGQEGERFLLPETIETDATRSYVVFEPLGVILSVMPWNFPFWQVFRCAVPAIMAGNALILKHASNVTGCALEIENVFREAEFPPGLFRAMIVSSRSVGRLIQHPVIRAVSLTGSPFAGRSVAKKAGESLKKTVLELGGSDPYILLEDADLESAVDICVKARLINSGQSCIAAKRFIVLKPVLKQFEEMFVEKMRAQKMGDPLEEGVVVGPLARMDLRNGIHEQVQKTAELGGKVLLGGILPDGAGSYYPPTVITDVKKGMPAYDEETFGPVAAIIAAENETEAVRLANDSSFGLGAAVFTRNFERGEQIARDMVEAGNVFVNTNVHSDPRLPFGGVKESGYGRELSVYGIREFTNIKTVYIRDSATQ